MRVKVLLEALKQRLESEAELNRMKCHIAADPTEPLTRILAMKAGGEMILAYEGQDRIDTQPAGAVPVTTRFAVWLYKRAPLAADAGAAQKLGDGQTLFDLCEHIERILTHWEIPNNDNTVEKRSCYERTQQASAPDGTTLACYKITFVIRRALV